MAMRLIKRHTVIILSAMLLVLAAGRNALPWGSADEASLLDNIIASSFKTLAKTFVFAMDVNKVKKNNLKKLKKMDEEKFSRQYAKVYNTLKDYPSFVNSYGLRQGLTRVEAIEKIRRLDKKKMYEMANAIPNQLIVSQFRAYMLTKKEGLQKSDIPGQIKRFWNKMVSKAYRR